MQTTEAEHRLRAMLDEAGFKSESPDLELAWRVFKSFVREPVECAEDGVLFECGTYSFTGENLFTWGFVRQFTIEVDGEYDHMEQLHFKFTCPPVEEFAEINAGLWAFDFPTLDEYFAKVEGLRKFQIALSSTQKWNCQIDQGDI